MRIITRLFCITLFFVIFAGCKQTNKSAIASSTKTSNNPEEKWVNKYSNEYFSIEIPGDWMYDDSNWGGRDSMQNEVDLYPAPKPGQKWEDLDVPCWIHCVKAYLKPQWKNVKEAAELSKTMHSLGNEPGLIGIIYEHDSLMVGGFPAYLIAYLIAEDKDTIVQKQFVTYLPKTHKVFYFNINFYKEKWTEGQEMGDMILSSLKFKDDADIE